MEPSELVKAIPGGLPLFTELPREEGFSETQELTLVSAILTTTELLRTAEL